MVQGIRGLPKLAPQSSQTLILLYTEVPNHISSIARSRQTQGRAYEAECQLISPKKGVVEKKTNRGKIPKMISYARGIRQRDKDMASITARMEDMMEQLKRQVDGLRCGYPQQQIPNSIWHTFRYCGHRFLNQKA